MLITAYCGADDTAGNVLHVACVHSSPLSWPAYLGGVIDIFHYMHGVGHRGRVVGDNCRAHASPSTNREQARESMPGAQVLLLYRHLWQNAHRCG